MSFILFNSSLKRCKAKENSNTLNQKIQKPSQKKFICPLLSELMHCPKNMCFVHTQVLLAVVPAVQCRTTWNNNGATRITFYAYTAARIGSYLRTRNLLLLKMFPASDTFMNSKSCNLNTLVVSHICLGPAHCNRFS